MARIAGTPFEARAKALFPGLPLWLIRSYARGLSENAGAPAANDLAWAKVRENRHYDEFFAGNKRADGSLRMTELEYLATVDGYRQNLAARGIDPSTFEAKFGKWIEGDVSVVEQDARIDAFDDWLNRWGPEGTNGYTTSMEWYATNYGKTLTREDILASTLDPELGQDIALGRIKTAQIGGAAAASGFNRTAERAEQLRALGLTGDQAMQFYGEAAGMLPQANTLAERFRDADGGVDIEDLEDAFVGNDAKQRRRLERNVQAETASFSGGGRVRTDQSGGMSGLRQQ